MNIKSFLFVLIINVLCFKAFSQVVSNVSQLDTITQKLTRYAEFEGREKTYLHTDRDSYCPGDTLWFKSYLLDGITHEKSNKSGVVYVELLNAKDSILFKRMLSVKETSSYGNIKLPHTMVKGNYKLRAFTRFMLNDLETPFYQKLVRITCNEQVSLQKKVDNTNSIGTPINFNNWSTKPLSDEVNIEFFSEGGNLVYGLSSLLTIKTVDYNGLPIAVKATINDANGKMIAPIETNNFGFGSVYFTPKVGGSYHVLIQDKGFRKKFKITAIENQGYSLSVKNRVEDIIIQLEASAENSLHNTLLVGYLKGEKILESLGERSNSKSYGVKLVTKELPDGVANFVLYDANGEIICNRQVFINSSLNDAIVTIQSNTKSLKTREKVQLSIAVSDANGKPIKGDFSMRVIPTRGIAKKAQMKNWLLLESDFCGLATNADLFFNNDSSDSKRLLDALLSVGEWRHSFANEANNQTNAHFYKPEKGIMISGKVDGVSHSKSSSKKNIILFSNLSDGFSEEKELDKNGKFSFGPYLFNDSIAAFLELVTKRKKSIRQRGKINLDAKWPKVPAAFNYNTCSLIKMPDSEIYESTIPDFEPIYTVGNDSEITYLKEVVVKKKKKSKKQLLMDEINSIALYGSGDERIFRESIKGWEGLSAMDLLARRGYEVRGSYPDQKVRVVRGPNSFINNNEPLIIIDGVVTKGWLNQLRARDILFIDVFRFGSASLFGTRGSNGVIIAYTHRVLRNANYEPDPNAGALTLNMPGFSQKQEFYLPDYAVSNEANYAKDYRKTLYWNPTVDVNNEGHSFVEFYTNDCTGDYTIEFEGVTESGEILYSSYDIDVQ